MNVLSLFDGISCGQVALKRSGIKVNQYYASEVDKNAMSITQTHFPKTIQLGDVTKVRYENGILFCENGQYNVGQIDIFMGGSPCTNFSFAGSRKGMATETGVEIYTLEDYLKLKVENFQFTGQSYLFFEYLRLLKEINPKFFLLENVRMHKKWQDVISKNLGVEPCKINSALVSAQNRPRIYWSNIPYPEIKDKGILLKDVLTKLPEKCYDWLAQYRIDKMKNGQYKYVSMYKVCDYDGKARCVMTDLHNSTDNKIWVGEKLRYLNNEENERLQTLDYGYTSGLPESRRKHAIGNGWTVDVIVEFFKNIEVVKND